MKFDAHAYTIQTRKVTEDGETFFKATVVELPHLATYESTLQEAYEVLIEDIQVLHETAVRLGHAFPEPIREALHEHSGRITLRIPRSLHRQLDEKSTVEGVSLNTCVTTLLAQGVAVSNVATAATAAILAASKSAVFSAGFFHGENISAEKKMAAGYTFKTQSEPMEETEQWTVQTH
jgi:predicted HicB family RNase H-like nuclease